MNNQFDELTKGLAPSLTRRTALKRVGLGLAGVALACFGPANSGWAQTSKVCDSAGDTTFSNGKGGPPLPGWLDLTQGLITADSNDNLWFTLTVGAPLPSAPAWSGLEDDGQFWWGWRMIGDLADITPVKNGCIFSKGGSLPSGYYLDLIWSTRESSFRARLVDVTTCEQVPIPFCVSEDRTQIIMVVAKSLFTNAVLMPNPDTFKYLTTTVVWKSPAIGNLALSHVDWAPDQTPAELVTGTWQAGTHTSYFCP